jgi:hypothetical protein
MPEKKATGWPKGAPSAHPQLDVTQQLGGPPHGDCVKKPRNFSRESNKNAQHGA